MGDDLFECASDVFFMHLGDLPGHADLPVRAKHLGELLERLEQSVGRLIEDHGACLVLQTLQSRLPSLLLWQETLKAETVAGQSRRHNGWDAGCSTGQRNNLNVVVRSLTGKEESRVADARRAGVTDQRDVLSGLETLNNARRCPVLIELVMGHEMIADLIVAKEVA